MAPMKRWLGRLLGFAVLIAVGYAAFHVSKTLPRCVIDSDTRIIHFAPDGNTIVTGHQAVVIGNYTGGDSDARGKPPLKVWDTRTGELLRRLLDDVKQFKRYAICEKRPLIAVALDGTIRLADWRTGKEWNVDVGPGEVEWLEFGPNGDVLSVRMKGQPQPVLMVDVDAGEVIERFERDARASGFSADGRLWRFVRNGRLHDWNIAARRVERDYRAGAFECDERLLVYSEPDDINFVICDAESGAVKTRIKPAMPPGIHDLGVIPAEVRAAMRRQIQACRHAEFSPSGRRVATFAQPFDQFDGVLEIWDTDTGERVAALPGFKRGWARFAFEDVLEFLDRSHTPHNSFPQLGPTVFNIHTIIDLPAGTVRWRRPANLNRFFVLNETTALHAGPEGTWDFLDMATGEARCNLVHPFDPDAFHVGFDNTRRYFYAFGKVRSPALTGEWEKWLGRWLPATTGRIQVVDTQDERVIFDVPTDASSGIVMSDDGRTLLIHDMGTIGFGRRSAETPGHRSYFYDLHSRRPWYWAVGTPAALLALWLLWRTWRVRRRRDVTAAAAMPVSDASAG
jgi:hypothetical protein